MSTPFGIYVHTPWCRSRCPYCAFNVYLSNSSDYKGWIRAVQESWRGESEHFSGEAHSLYFGGGTPSLAPVSAIRSVIKTMPLAPGAEVTLETNPGTIDADGLRGMVDAGVNRLSLGIQTFDRRHAKRLGRGHTVQQAHELLGQAHELGFSSWSMDLMFALPEQTAEELAFDLERLLEHNPPHVSLYGLSIEPDTPFAVAEKAGALTTPPSDDWRRMYDTIVGTLEGAGWERYEVSNFARPGHRGVHNEAVWRGGHYAGLGPGAHGFRPCGTRTVGPSDLSEWLDAPNPQLSHPSKHEAAIDRILSTLRHSSGLNLDALMQDTGFEVAPDTLHRLRSTQCIRDEGSSICLTHSSFPMADGIVRRIIEGLVPAQVPSRTT